MHAGISLSQLPSRYRHFEHEIWVQQSAGRAVGAIVEGFAGQGAGDGPAVLTLGALRQHLFEHPDLSANEARIRPAVLNALEVVQERMRRAVAKKPNDESVGAELTALILAGSHAVIMHVGTGRAYRWRHHEIEQLTTDHVVSIPPGSGEPLSARRLRPPAVVPGSPLADVRIEPTMAGDMFVLCSRQAARSLEPVDVAKCLYGVTTAEAACAALEAAAAQRRTVNHDSSIVVARVYLE